MTGNQLENYLVHVLSNNGWWALRIPRNPSGAQPFDVIAVKGSNILAVDCKACMEPKFALKRIEDNQWTAFERMMNRTDAVVGIVAENEGQLYFVDYIDLMNCNRSYLPLDEKYIKRFVDVCHCSRKYLD